MGLSSREMIGVCGKLARTESDLNPSKAKPQFPDYCECARIYKDEAEQRIGSSSTAWSAMEGVEISFLA